MRPFEGGTHSFSLSCRLRAEARCLLSLDEYLETDGQLTAKFMPSRFT